MKLTDEQKVNKIVKTGYELNQRTEDIADLLNNEGLRTESGKEFTASTVSNIAIRKLGLRKREKNTRNRTQKTFEVQEINFVPAGPAEVETIEDNSEVKLSLIDRAVFSEAGKVFTDSLLLADIFDKQHFHILRDIENLECSKTFTESNFGLSEYKDITGRTLKKYLLTKDGFSFLVLGYTGKKAAQFKEKFIQKFNEMEKALSNPSPVVSVDPLDMLQVMLNTLRDQALKVNNLESKVNLIDNKIDQKLEQITAKASKELDTFKEPSPVYQIDLFNNPNTDQAEVDRLIKTYAAKKVINPQIVYRALYSLYQSVKKINLYQRASNAGVSKLTYITRENLLPEFYSFVYKHLIECDGSYLKIQEVA